MPKIWYRNPRTGKPIVDDAKRLGEAVLATGEPEDAPGAALQTLSLECGSPEYVHEAVRMAAQIVVDFLVQEGDPGRTIFVIPRLQGLMFSHIALAARARGEI